MTEKTAQNQKNPLNQNAARLVFELLKLDAHEGPEDHQRDLSKVQSLREFIFSPATPEAGQALADALQRIPAPKGTSTTLENFVPYRVGDVLTQKAPAAGDSPVYSFPLPGQPVRLLGSPADFVVPDGSRWDEDASRWICEDVRILAHTPAGPVVMSVDVEEFNPWTPHAPKWTEIEDEVRSILDKVEANILDAIAQKAQKVEG